MRILSFTRFSAWSNRENNHQSQSTESGLPVIAQLNEDNTPASQLWGNTQNLSARLLDLCIECVPRFFC